MEVIPLYSRFNDEATSEELLHNAKLRQAIGDFKGAINDCTMALKLNEKDYNCLRFRFLLKIQSMDYRGAIYDLLHPDFDLLKVNEPTKRSMNIHDSEPELFWTVYEVLDFTERARFRQAIRNVREEIIASRNAANILRIV